MINGLRCVIIVVYIIFPTSLKLNWHEFIFFSLHLKEFSLGIFEADFEIFMTFLQLWKVLVTVSPHVVQGVFVFFKGSFCLYHLVINLRCHLELIHILFHLIEGLFISIDLHVNIFELLLEIGYSFFFNTSGSFLNHFAYFFNKITKILSKHK